MIDKLKSRFITTYRGQLFYSILTYFYDLGSLLTWRFDESGRESVIKLQKYKNAYSGKRCFIIGNGPSLRRTNLSYLKNEYTFGLNRIFLLFPKIDFYTNFLVSVNNLVIEQSFNELNSVKSLKYFSWKNRKYLKFMKNTIFVRTLARACFSKDITKGVWEGSTVTYVAMQIAYYLGFEKVILIGVDHSFKTKGEPHRSVVSDKKDVDHFSDNYFGRGFVWNLPDLSSSEYAYSLAKKSFEKDGREVLDATIGGKLKVFKKVKYQDLFSKKLS